MYSRPHSSSGPSAFAPDVHIQIEDEPDFPSSRSSQVPTPGRTSGHTPGHIPGHTPGHTPRTSLHASRSTSPGGSSAGASAHSSVGSHGATFEFPDGLGHTVLTMPPFESFLGMSDWVDDVAQQCSSQESLSLAERLRRADCFQEAKLLEMNWEDDSDDLDSEVERLSNAGVSRDSVSSNSASSASFRSGSARSAFSAHSAHSAHSEPIGNARIGTASPAHGASASPSPGPDPHRSGDPLQACTIQIESYLTDGNIRGLPPDLQRAVREATYGTRPSGPSGRLLAVLAGLRQLSDRMDDTGLGRTALNFGHTTVRSLGSVGLTTLARQAVGRAIDLALASGTSELTRTLIGAGAMGLPILGQMALLWRDHRQQEATPYSRLTRMVLTGLCLGTCGLAVATGTLTNPGLRLAEVVLYPLLRDAVQARFPMISDPDSGPTKRSLAVAGGAYAVNQLGVSRAFAAAPDATATGLLMPGLLARSLANAAGESVDLMSLLYANHMTRHGRSTVPRLRIGSGDVAQAIRTPLHWDTMTARGCFVAGFNQLYDTMLADNTLTRLLSPVVGEAHAFTAADWLTELTAAALTVITYPFWTDPVHARGFDVRNPPTPTPTRAPSLAQVTAMEEGEAAPGLAKSRPATSPTHSVASTSALLSRSSSPALQGSAGSPGSPSSVGPLDFPGSPAPTAQHRSLSLSRSREPVQYAGNHAEPPVATDTSGVTLLKYVNESEPGRIQITRL